MRTASELLGVTPPAPLSATLVARPVKTCTFVPAVEGVPWEVLVEHALATQTRVWGGTSTIVVPLGWDVGEDELFWRLLDALDPDVITYHEPTFADVEEIAPASYEAGVADLNRQMSEHGFDQAAQDAEIERRRDHPFWNFRIAEPLQDQLVERLALLHVSDAGAREVIVDGTSAPTYPFTDVGQLRDLPDSVMDVTTTLGDLERLLLTHSTGRVLPSFRAVLAARGVRLNAVSIGHEEILFQHLWPNRRVIVDFTYPNALARLGPARRLAAADRGLVTVALARRSATSSYSTDSTACVRTSSGSQRVAWATATTRSHGSSQKRLATRPSVRWEAGT
jgi:hypothetical protein